MAKKKTSKKKTSARAKPRRRRAQSVSSIRARIDRMDRELIKLCNERAKLAIAIGKIKENEGDECYSPGREEEVLTKVQAASSGPLDARSIRAIFRELISGSRALEKDRLLRVGYLGPPYSFSHLAAIERFGQTVEYVPVGSIAAVFEEINRAHVDYGLVPIENSTDGRVADTLDMFVRLPMNICAEVRLRVHHHLLARCARADVTEVYSRPQALSQCRNWLSRNLPQARLHEVTSTSTAAQLARDKPGAAAVASRQAGQHYGLDTIAESIEDNPSNLTRFAVIGKDKVARTGNDKTAIMFNIPHRPGSLADVLAVFKRNKVNLTWIESFPLRGPEPGYLFFTDFDGHERDARVRRTLASLQRKTDRLVLLGSYPASAPLE
jgi:chorismate mutase/prephenate dehydratase